MSFNLLEVVKGQFNNELISKAASLLGENENGVTKAISGIVPSVLSGIIAKGTSGSNGAEEVLNVAKTTSNGGLFSNLSGLLGNGDLLSKGAGLLKGLLGEKTSAIVTAISSFAGIKSSSADSLMSMAAPIVLSSVGKHATENNLSSGGLMDMFNSQKSTILSALPSGLSSIFSLLGVDKVANIASLSGTNTKASVTKIHEYTEKKTAGISWLLPLLLLAAAGILAWWFLLGGKQGCAGKKTEAGDTTAVHTNGGASEGVNTDGSATAILVGKVDTATGDFIYDLGKMITIDLPNNGGKLEVGENSTEAKLVAFLNDGSKAVDTIKGNWFEFTNVKFKTGSSTITEESLEQIKNMILIAKSYPTAQFKLGGYTDNTGDAAKNVVLSQKRADVVLVKLKELGATENSLAGAKGYGPEWPIGDNTTAEGRAMNRRVAVNVKAK
jgi:outer membrane protein OmpA-like peptidoglycan-associated protein